MATSTQSDWTEEFGIDGREPPRLFTRVHEITGAAPQAHLLRQAFKTLKVDGILCADHSPLVYFKIVKRITPEAVYDLHRQFWNHSAASILVLITHDRVHVYSGMVKPSPAPAATAVIPSLVTSLDRVASVLRDFIVSVESGAFFRRHQRSFDPSQRVDRDLLDNLRSTHDELEKASRKRVPVVDALLCRLVFTCYLFDRGVIGSAYLDDLNIPAADLRALLSLQPASGAKTALYRLFDKLGEDFNGDLFSDDLAGEAEWIQDRHIEILNSFFQGTDVRTGQRTFWPYDFRFIPIETISAIYERFLNSSEDQKGVFYTPRFLAEVVLDTALENMPSLAGRRFLDPACGSGIFLVGLFNRMAEEWKQANPTARNDRKATELMRLLRESLFGVDISLTACRITAFSLYLAYLDQLSPPDIQALQKKGRALPQLVVSQNATTTAPTQGNIFHADFFADRLFPRNVSLVIGNPPWGSIAARDTPAGKWCAAHAKPLPDKQIAAAFIWKATEHVASDGRICLVLPHGVLFNHSTTALLFQKAWVASHSIDRVLNLADFQRFLFEKAGHPAVVVKYGSRAPSSTRHPIEYWVPKADWTVTKAEVITVAPQDRTTVTVGEVLEDLDGPDAPHVWKRHFWATPRDWRLLDRLSTYPRLREMVGSPSRRHQKRWTISQGYEERETPSDDLKYVALPSRLIIEATSPFLDLFLGPSDCDHRESTQVALRKRSNTNTEVFYAPHVLVAKGLSKVAYAGFDVTFRHAVRGIRGPKDDRDLLVFLAGYLRTNLARYFLFHTSSNWGVSRQEVHGEEVLRLPFPVPDQQPNPKRSWQIIRQVAEVVDDAAHQASHDFADRAEIVRAASRDIEPLVDEYFDVLPPEKLLIEDTIRVIINSARPTRARPLVPTLMPATATQQNAYSDRLCEMLNGWAKRGPFAVRACIQSSESLGLGIVILEKVNRDQAPRPMTDGSKELIPLLDTVRKAIPTHYATLDVVRGVMVFEGNRLYIVKPIGQRFWTQTAAMNDADEIAGTILMRSPAEGA